jgi:hypothetical protein
MTHRTTQDIPQIMPWGSSHTGLSATWEWPSFPFGSSAWAWAWHPAGTAHICSGKCACLCFLYFLGSISSPCEGHKTNTGQYVHSTGLQWVPLTAHRTEPTMDRSTPTTAHIPLGSRRAASPCKVSQPQVQTLPPKWLSNAFLEKKKMLPINEAHLKTNRN